MVSSGKNLDDEVIEGFYKLGEELRGIPEQKYFKSLKGILYEEAGKYFNEGKDEETHELKWENDDQLREFTDILWNRAADHIAEHYLGWSANRIKEMRGMKDPDDPNQTQFEALIAFYLGTNREDFFETLRENEIMTPENLLEYLKPLYEQHIKIRQTRKIRSKIKSYDDAANLFEYVKLMKEHNPKSVKLRLPKKIDTVEKATDLYIRALSALPESYHPLKKGTYERK